MDISLSLEQDRNYVLALNGVEFSLTEGELVKMFGRVPDKLGDYELKKKETGPRWEKPRYDWLTYVEFLGQYGKYDAYLGLCSGINAVVLVEKYGGGYVGTHWLKLPDGQGGSDCKTWVEECKRFGDWEVQERAQIFLKVYNEALASKKLPPHPRYDRPEGAHTFLGWCDCYENDQVYDAWASDTTLFLGCLTGGSGKTYINKSLIESNNHTGMWEQAYNLAKEKGVINKTKEAKKRQIDTEIANLREKINDLQRKRDEI